MQCRASLAIVILVLACPANGQEVAPSSKWILNEEKTGCLLQREFAGNANRVTLAIRRLPLSDSADILFISDGKARAPSSGQVTLRAGSVEWNGVFEGGATSNGRRVAKTQIPISDLQRLSTGQQVEFFVSSKFRATLVQVELASALAAEKTCEAAVLNAWGISQSDWNEVATPPRALKFDRWITPADYPKSALQMVISGKVLLAWKVDASGHVVNCMTIQSSGSKELDDKSCSLLTQRGKYEPARNKEGGPTSTWQAAFINWTIPNY